MTLPIPTTQYTVGWLAPMSLELTAAIAILQDHKELSVPDDEIGYHVGRIGAHYVVMAVCSTIGTHAATAVVVNMRRSFRNIKHILVVGVAGGIPQYGLDLREQIVLGDIVISVPQNNDGGVKHYEFGAWEGKDKLNVSGHTLQPSSALLGAVNNLRCSLMLKSGTRIPQFLRDLREKIGEDEQLEFKDPGPQHDRLFYDDYIHSNRAMSCEALCNMSKSKRRDERGSRAARKEDTPRIHYGTIGSANTLMISSEKRNYLYKHYGVICFEMEAAGVLSNHRGLVIRGICDYADSHKNKEWQKYAAAVAAACAKEILLYLPTTTTGADSPQAKDSRTYKSGCIAEELLQITTTHDDEVIQLPKDDNNGAIVELNLLVEKRGADKQLRTADKIAKEQSNIPPNLCPAMSPEAIISKCKSFARRRKFWNPWPEGSTDLFRKLQRWISTPGSLLFVVRADRCVGRRDDLRAKKRTKDFAVEVADFLKSKADQKVIWTFSSPDMSITDDLIVLIYQASLFVPLPNTPQSKVNDTERLFDILHMALSHLSECFVIIETPNVGATARFLQVSQNVVDISGSMIKIMVVSYETSQVVPNSPQNSKRIVATVQRPRRSRKPRIRHRSGGAGWIYLNPRFQNS